MSADELRAWRLRLGWKQIDAAKRLGYSLRQYVAMEHGETEIPRVVALACLALEDLNDETG